MKNPFESSEVFTAFATVGAGYFLIRKAQEEFEAKYPKNVVERMVDDATGAGKARLNEHVKYIQECLSDIIEAKKVLEDDYSQDAKAYESMNEMIL